MKKINLIEWLWKTDSHEKQSPQRFFRYAVMLIMLLTLGVGQMWAVSEGSTWRSPGSTSNAYVYFDNTNSSYSNVSMLIGRQWNYGGDGVGSWGINFSKVSGTNNLYYANVQANSYTTFCFIDATNWGWETNKVTARYSYASHYTNSPNDDLGTSTHLYVPASSSNNASVTHTTPSSYTSLNYTQTLNQKLSTDGGSTFSTSTASIATVTVSSNKLNGNNSTTSDSGEIGTGESSTSCLAARTATVTYEVDDVATGYTFVGWYDGDTQKSTNTTYTYTATGAKTITARFKEDQYSLTFSHNGHGSIAVGGNTVSSGSTANVNYFTTMTLVASPSTGYNFSGWTKSGSNTGSVTIGNAANASTTIKATNTGATVTAGFTAKTYTITLDDNGSYDGDGSATATYNSSTLSFSSHASRTDYRVDGYYAEAGLTTKVINADGTLVANVTNYTGAGGIWTRDADTKLYAKWVYDVTEYKVTFGVGTSYTSLGSLSAYDNTASSSISTGSDVRSGHSVTFTASPNTGYTVEGWYTDASCTLGKHDAGSLTYTASISAATNVYVKFEEKTWSVAFAAGTGGSVTTPAATPQTVGQLTGISIAATPSTGYTFNTWTITSGSGSFTSSASTNSNTFKPTAASTVTASFNETMSSLSTSCHYDAGNPSYAAPTVSNSATTIGYGTTRTITAAAAGTGYTFAGWTITNGVRTDGGDATANPITVRSNGDGAAVTVVANYNEDLTQSTWVLKGGTNVTGDNWATEHALTKKTGHSTESVVYYTATISSTNAGDDGSSAYSFKIVKKGAPDTWYGLGDKDCGDGEWWYNRATGEQTMNTGNKNIQIIADVAGPYEIKVDYSTPASPKVTVTFPTSYTLTYSVGSVPGTSGSFTTSPTTASGSKVLSGTNVTLTAPAAKTGYTWKGWYTNAAGTEGKITDVSRAITVTMNADKTLYACYTENDYTVTVAAGAGGSVASTSVTGHKDTKVTLPTATPNVGYVFTGWTVTSGTATLTSASSATAAQINGMTAAVTVTANFAAATAYIEGRFHVTNESRNGTWTNTFSEGNWDENSTAIKFTWDGTNSRYELHTYAKPQELTTQISGYNPFFYVKESSSSSSLANVTSYWSATSQTLTTSGSGNKKSLVSSGTFHNDYLRFNSSDESGYAVIYFDEAGIWYELEQRLQYNANGGTGSAPTGATGNNTYHARNATITAPANTYTRTGYTFAGWKVNNAGATIAAGASVTMSADVTLYAQWTENLTTVTLQASPAGKGSFTIGGDAATSTTAGVSTKPSVTAVPAAGYYVNTSSTVWTTNNSNISLSSTTAVTTVVTGGGTTSTSTLTATFTPNPYSVRFNANGGTGSMSDQAFTYDVAQNLTANAFTKTGYTFGGWATSQANADAGTKAYDDEEEVSNLTTTKNGTYNLYAIWTAKQSALTLDYQTSATGYASSGSISNTVGLTGTYDADMTALTGTMPSAQNGYAFMGFYDAVSGGGTKYYNADGTSAHTWDKDTESGTTLYAYYKKAEITGITFTDGAVVAPSTSKTVTAVIDPTPTGTATVCWRVLYSNDNPMDPQPSFSSVSGNSVSFTAPAASGMYKMEAVLHLGSGCGGEELSTYVAPFQVAGDHEVTVQYMCGGEAIKASETMIARPLDWSDDITAPDIFGYTFSRWVALDGVSIKDHANDTSTTATIQIKAVYDGKLKAEYTQNQIIYFKNTLGWENVFVNFYSSSYWNNPKGSGNEGVTNRNKKMTRIGDTDVWYYDYGAASITPSLYVSFTSSSRDGVTNFWGDNPFIAVVYPANYQDDIHTDKSLENGFKAATPMFVPLADQTPTDLNASGGGKACYYNRGYWTKYTAGTGYTLEIYYDSDESSCIQSIPFTSEDDLMPMSAVVDLEASTTYRYQVRRGGVGSTYGIYYGNTGTMTYANHGAGTGWIMENTMAGGFKKAKITTNASGNYTFNLSYSPNASNEYRLRMEVDYPIADKDYRLIYMDNVQTKDIKSAIVTKANNSKDTVSFFVRPGSTPVLKIQQATVTGAGAITWNDYSTISSHVDNAGVDALSKDSVYNICLTMDGSGAISVENVEAYTGDFYIRTNAAGASKWDNFRSADHLMTYSEYSATNADYSHYFMAYVGNGTNVKFVVANDYAPNISDTVIVQTYRGGDASHVDENGNIKADANVRFMWNRHNNGAYRAYLAAAKNDGSKFLVLRANSNTDLMDENGNALLQAANEGQAGYNHKVPDNSMQFIDDENWIYETTVKVRPSSFVKLYATFHGADFYYKGENNNTFDKDNAIQLMTGDGSAEKIRVIYDFKTDRLVAAWLPSGNIDEVREINADVMFIREHQGDIEQLTFTKGDGETMGAITEIKTAYAVLRFNKWTLNNKSKTGAHAVLDPGASRYERDMFYVSFPFRVSMNEVFGFGKYGQHWIVEEYDGASRAANGFWAETPTYWRFVTDRKGKFFEPNQGYIIALDLDELGETSSVWDNGVENVELYFPSYGTMGNITNATVMYNLPAHECTINRPTPDGDRRIKDSHWNVMPVPTYINTSNVAFSNTTWTATRPSFLYEWNMNDNSLTPRSGSGYTYHAMHAYIVQYAGDVTWTSTSVTPSSIVARERTAPSEVEFRIELSENEQTIDQTYVRLSNDEEVSTGFVFGEDMSKEFNKSKANIYTFIGTEQVAGNVLPMSEQTTVVPVGVKIVANGDYTFSIPDGTEGTGVTLIDNETGVHTNLALMDYTVALEAGTYDGRFILEISPIAQTPTGVDTISDEGLEMQGARKVLIDEKMYILKDGKVYDARGARVQ